MELYCLSKTHHWSIVSITSHSTAHVNERFVVIRGTLRLGYMFSFFVWQFQVATSEVLAGISMASSRSVNKHAVTWLIEVQVELLVWKFRLPHGGSILWVIQDRFRTWVERVMYLPWKRLLMFSVELEVLDWQVGYLEWWMIGESSFTSRQRKWRRLLITSSAWAVWASLI